MTVNFRPAGYTYATASRNTKPLSTSPVRFGLLACLTPENKDKYEKHPNLHKLFPYATRLYREAAVNDFLGFLLNKDRKPTAIHDLGCSVGSSTDSIGIAARHYLKPAIWKDPM